AGARAVRPRRPFLQRPVDPAEGARLPSPQTRNQFFSLWQRGRPERSSAPTGNFGLPCPDLEPLGGLQTSTSNLPCWLVEEFVVTTECSPCSNFQAKTTPECGPTGYVEKITCSSSKRIEFKSCRSALMEQHLSWKFEGAVVFVALIFACHHSSATTGQKGSGKGPEAN
uniref:Protein JTB n=1 Tax=Theropithecus gelada TaxID=9565 RepID=A0A8D2G5K8_THEGE